MRAPPDPNRIAAHPAILLALLWLAGAGTRIPILAVPPVIPLIRDDLRLSETLVGILTGLPLVLFALAAVPGSMLIARHGAMRTTLIGLLVAAIGSAGRAVFPGVGGLFATTMLMGLGVAIMQPALPRLVREWLPNRIGLGSALYTNGALLCATLAVSLTIPVVLPLVDGNWRLDLLVWSVPVFATALLFWLLAPRQAGTTDAQAAPARWWPDWRSPLTWRLGLTFGSNNSVFFATNGFLPDYLHSAGREDLIGPALTAMNGAQLVASFLLLALAHRVQHRAWPYLVFGPAVLTGVLGMAFTQGYWIVASAALTGFSLAITFVGTLALPAILSAAQDVHRAAAGMFTISYSLAVIIPIISGALWDFTGVSWMAFVPMGLCAIALTTLGAPLSRHRAAAS